MGWGNRPFVGLGHYALAILALAGYFYWIVRVSISSLIKPGQTPQVFTPYQRPNNAS